MKKTIFLIIVGICIGFYLFTPQDSKVEVAYHTKTNNFNPKVAKFLISTKVGRKVSYIFLKKSGKKQYKQLKKETNRYLKELEIY